MAAFVVAVAALGALPLQAQAQTVYVSNLEKNGVAVSSPQTQAQSFTTGSVAGGYELESVDISLSLVHSSRTIAASIYSATGGLPDTELYSLTSPGSIVSFSVNTFTAPANAMLSANTTYFVVMDPSDTLEYTRTASDAEDTAEPGWSITHKLLSRPVGSTTWGTRYSASMRIAINGPGSDDATLSGLTANDGTNDLILSPGFGSGTYVYAANVGYAVTTVTLTATVNDANASVTGVTLGGTVIADTDFTNGITVPSLVEGDNVIVVTVTAEDATTQAYTVTVTRRMTPGVTVSELGLTVTEENTTGDTYTVVLDSEPTASVAIEVGGTSGTSVTATPSPLTFTTVTWDTPQTVTVKAVDDADLVDNLVSLTHAATSTDSDYDGITIAGVTVMAVDNDTAKVTGVSLTPGDGELVVQWTAVGNAAGYEVQWKSGVEVYNSTRQAAVTPGTTTSHTLSGLTNGTTYTVRVRATRTGANNGPYSDEEMDAPEAGNTLATGAPAITGTPQVGLVLTAAKGTIADADGTTMADNGDTGYAYSYQWVRVDGGTETSITSATASTYTLTATDLGKTIKVQASFKDDEDTAEGPLPSAATVAVVAAAGACPAGNDWCATMTVEYRDAVLGKGFIESTGTGMLSDTTIDRDVVFMVREIRIVEGDAAVIFGLNDYLPIGTVFDLGGTNFTADAAAEQSHTGRYSWSVPAGFDWIDGQDVTVSVELANFAATGKPTISGTAQVGETLTAAIGDIADTDGLPATFPADYTFQWLRVDADGVSNETNIGTDSETYTPVAADVGKKVKVQVSFTDDEGTGEERTSNVYPSSGTITDTTTPGVTISQTALTVTEQDTTGDTYTVVLDSEPTASVTVTVAGHASTAVNPTPTSLTFTTSNWSTAQTVTVTAGNDTNTADETVSLTHSAASTDSDYAGIMIAGVTVEVEDNDTAKVTGVVLTPGDGELVVEWVPLANATGYEVQWKSGGQSYDDSGRQATIGSGSTASHTLSGLTNGTTYTVRMRATRTDANNGPYSDEAMDAPEAPAGPTVTISADETSAVFKEDSIIYTLTRSGATTDALPVSVTLTQDKDFLAAADLTRTVTIAAGQSTNTFTVAASSFQHFAAGAAVEGGTLTATVQDGADYDPGAPAAVDVAIVIGVMVRLDMASYSVGEAAGTLSYKLIARTGPDAPQPSSVTSFILVKSEDGTASKNTDFTVVNFAKAFTPADFSADGAVWEAEEPYTVSITSDSQVEIDETFNLTLQYHSDAASFSLVDASGNSCGTQCTSSVTIIDDDSAGITVSKAALTVEEEDTTGDTYTVVLNSQPTANVTITIGGQSGTDVTAAPSPLTFTPMTWATARTVTVTAADDADTTNDTVTLTHTATSTDPFYTAVAASVTVTVNDNDTANTAPAFPSSTADRSVAENTAAGQNVGGVLTATDSDGDTLTYTLEGTDAASFDLVTTTDPAAQIRTRTGVTYNHEDDYVYTVVVKADDSNGGTDTVTVAITVTDEAEAPGRPAAPTLTAVSNLPDHFIVEWLAPTNTGPEIDTYDLRYQKTTESTWTNGPQDQLPHATGGTAGIMGLDAGTAYRVQVRATNDEGDGEWSQSGTGTTSGAVTVRFEQAAYSVAEGGNVTVKVILSADPERNLNIPIEWTNLDGATNADRVINISSVDFVSGEMENDALVFSATQDSIDDDGESVELRLGTLPAGVTHENPTFTTVNITDDDTAAVTVSETALTVTEQELTGDTYTVVLDSQPTDEVAILINGQGTDVITTPTPLYFTPMNWATAQTVTVTGFGDSDLTNDTVTLTHTATSTDSNYDGITIADVTVTVEDNDTAQVTGLMVTPGNARLVVQWTAVGNAAGYEVQWKSGVEVYNSSRQAAVTPGTTTSYTIPNLTNGTTYTVRVRATRTGANPGAYSDEAMDAPEAGNTLATGAPAITGTPQVGMMLTAAKGTIADADGTTKADNGDTGYAYSYQWLRVDGGTDSPITGATASTYTLTATDLGKTIKVRTSFTDDGDTAEGPLTSAATVAVLAAAGACPTPNDWCTTLTVGFRQQSPSVHYYGYIETFDTGALDDRTINYGGRRWRIYALYITDDAGTRTIKVDFAIADGFLPRGSVFTLGGQDFTATAAAEDATQGIYTWPVPAAMAWIDGQEVTVSVKLANFAATGEPAISGTAQVDETLTAAIGDIADTDGLPATFPDDYTFQWLRVDADGVSNETNIGTDSETYTPVAADVGKKVRVQVSFTDDEGADEERTSNAYPSSGTIVSETLPALSFVPTVVTVDEDAGSATITVELAPASSGTVTVEFATRDHGAKDGEDYTATSGTLTFTAGQTSKTITVPILNDDVYEASAPTGEIFFIDISNPTGATLPDPPAIAVRIDSEEAVPTASMADVTVDEGAGTMTLTLRLSHPSQVDIAYFTRDDHVTGTATEGEDYDDFLLGAGRIARITVPAFNLLQTFDITLVDDGVDEPDETIVIIWQKLSTSDVTPSTFTFTGTITDNDATGSATGKPVIFGTIEVGQTLTADTSGIADPDGLTNVSYTYQWVRVDGTNETNIAGATGSSYTLVAADEGKGIRVRVSFNDDAGNPETLTSDVYRAVTLLPAPRLPAVDDPNAIWMATLTVANLGSNQYGYKGSQGGLTDTAFTYLGDDTPLSGGTYQEVGTLYTIDELSYHTGTGQLLFSLDGQFVGGSAANIFVDVGGTQRSFSQGTYSSVPHTYTFSIPNPSWTAGDEVTVKIVVLAQANGPGNLAATSAESGGQFNVTLDWDAPAGGGTVTGYRVESQPDPALQWWTLAASQSGTTYADSGLARGTVRYYRVAALRSGGASYSDIVRVQAPSETAEAPEKVDHVDVEPSDTALEVAWNRARTLPSRAPATGYHVQYAQHDGAAPAVRAGENWASVTFPRWMERLPWRTWSGVVEAIEFEESTERSPHLKTVVTGLAPGTNYRVRVRGCTEAGCGGWSYPRRWTTSGAALNATEAEPLTATLEDFPVNHDGSSAFTFRIAFSAEVVISRQDMKEHALTVTGGTVTRARRVDRRKDLWELTVEPAGTGAVSVLVPLGRACTETGALCTADGQALTTGLGHSVPGPAPQGQQALAPLAAAFVSVPAEHDGETEFWLELSFDAAVEQGSKTGIRALLGVTGGSETKIRRKDDRLDHWRVRVEPSSHEAVTVTLSPSPPCGATGAVCTEDGRTFTSTLATQIQGPPGLTVADAQVREAANATLAFAVTLSRAPSGTVTVGYATSDGTATAGSDYTAASGTLTFAAGETAKTVSVPVLDDAHDEGSETLTLTLSNASGAYLEDGTATGTINNTDPMPQAWLARFGRTVGTQVVDALGQRLEGATASHVTVGGIPLTGAPGAVPEAEPDDPFGLPEWATRAQREESARSLTANDLLLGSAFHLSSGGGQGAGAAYTAWGRVATSGFAAEVDGVTMDADVTSGLVGFDAEWARVLAGVMFSHSTGEGDYRLSAESGGKSGRVESSLTGVYPYARVALNARMSAWALAGAASGELTLKPQDDKPMPAGITMRMGAAGFNGRVLDGTGASGLALDVKTDALWVGTKSEDTSELAPTEGDVTRLRVTLAGERAFAAGKGARLTPSAEVGLRHDGGDAESGTGLEVGAGLSYVAGALTVEGQVRTLVAHEDSGYEEWGVSGTVRITPSASGRGLMLRFAPQWGRTASAVQRLWSAPDASALGAGGEFEGGDARLVFDAGYGVGLGHGRGVLTPYAGLVLGDAGSRTVRTGARWQVGADAVLGLEGTRRTSGTGEAGNELMLRVALRF